MISMIITMIGLITEYNLGSGLDAWEQKMTPISRLLVLELGIPAESRAPFPGLDRRVTTTGTFSIT